MSRVKFVKKYLKLGGREVYMPGSDRKMVSKFVMSNLGFDGVLILRLLSTNVGVIMTFEIIKQLWITYRDRQEGTPDANRQSHMQIPKVANNAGKCMHAMEASEQMLSLPLRANKCSSSELHSNRRPRQSDMPAQDV